MKGWQLFYWHVSIILFAMATVHSLWQPLRLMTHWAWTIRIRKHVQTDPHGAKSSIPTGPSSCPEQCGRPWDIQYIFPCLHPTFTTYIIIYIYMCVCVFDFQEVSRLGIPNSNGSSYIIILSYIIIYIIIYDHIWSNHIWSSFSPYFQSGYHWGYPRPFVAELWDGRLVAFPLAYHGCFSRWASALKLGDGKGS